MDSGDPGSGSTTVTWTNVGLALSFIGFNVVVSGVLQLGVGTSLAVAALRCIAQLAVVGTVLAQVFMHEDPWATAGIVLLLNLLGAFEIVVNKSRRRYRGMFTSVVIGLLGSTIPIAIVGSKFAIADEPFWKPIKFIPIVGMLCGNTISGIVIAIGYIMKEICDNRDKVEVYLAFGASRLEACRPIVRDALRTALMPSINSMSVLGIISIPGMMTGAILGGSSVEQAAKLQMVIMFMICAATALSTIYTTISAVIVMVDSEHRIRDDRIHEGGHMLQRLAKIIGDDWRKLVSSIAKRRQASEQREERGSNNGEGVNERTSLLGNGNHFSR